MQALCRHLTPNTAEWHACNVGMLIGNLQSLEFCTRAAVARMSRVRWGGLNAMQPCQLVPEDPMTNYDQLGTVLQKFNGLASAKFQLDVEKIVDLRDQLAHGRVSAITPDFPLTLLKFGIPAKGMVRVLARIEMTEAWFAQQRRFVYDSIQAVDSGLVEWDTSSASSCAP